MKAFLINLEIAKDRLVSCKKEFKKIAIDYEVVKAIDGEKTPPTKKAISKYSYILKHGKKVNPREVACYSSHLKALKIFLDSSEEYGLICEDDIEFNENFSRILKECLRTYDKFDILRLAGSEDKSKEKGNPIKLFELERDHFISLNLTYKPIAACYLINRKAAKSILKNMRIMHLPYDYALDRDWLLGVRSLTIYPSIVNLKKEYHIENSFIKATKSYKLNIFFKLWTVVPYRLYLEARRFIYKVLLLVKIKLFES